MTFSLTWGWQGDGRQDSAWWALTNTLDRFNAYGDFTGGNGSNVAAAYNPGVPTAQAGYGGWGGIIEYGGTWPNDRVTQHELNHWLGSGTWGRAYDGPRTIAIIEQFEGVGARITTDGTHFWPYGLNYDNEWSELNAQRNVALTYAQRADWGIGSTANPTAWNATSVSLTSSDPVGASGFNHYSTWSDNTFAHPNADYATGAFNIRTPNGYSSWTFAGKSLIVNSGGRLLYNSWGKDGVTTIDHLILDGGSIRHDQYPIDKFRLDGNITVASNSTIDAARGEIEILSTIRGSGSLTKIGSYSLTLASSGVYIGDTNLLAGTLELSETGTTGFGTTTLADGTTLGGNGIVRGALVAQAGSTIRAGESLTVNGDFNWAAGSTISFDIASPGVNDSIDIGGGFSATDGVILEVQLESSVSVGSLLAGDSWDLFDFDPRYASGSFDLNDFSLPSGLASGLEWDVSKLLTTGVLAVANSFPPGDFNRDGRVDGGDFLEWQRNPGVGNLAEWEANYGNQSLSANTSTVPEPSSLLLALGLGCICLPRRFY